MGYRVDLTSPAETDVHAAFEYTLEHSSEEAAKRWLAGLFEEDLEDE
jgi:plasmid stabilization system protein ParE